MVMAENKIGIHTSIGIKEFPYNAFKYKNIYMAVLLLIIIYLCSQLQDQIVKNVTKKNLIVQI